MIFSRAVLAMRFLLKLASAIVVAAALDLVSASNPTKEEWDNARQAEGDEANAVAAREKKMSAVDKAIDMLEGLRTQVLNEGEEEATTYNKFACFCKDTTTDPLEGIKSGEDEQGELTTEIGSLEQKREGLDTKIQTAMDDIKILDGEMKDAEATRKSTFRLYGTNTVDLSGALEALQGAIQTLKASKNPTLMQIRSVSKTVRTAALLADAMGLGGKSAEMASTFFLQQDPANEVQMEDYKYHSEAIIKTLEDLLDDFKKEKREVDEVEVDSVRQHDLLMQEKTHATKMKNRELDQARKDKSQGAEDLAAASQQLPTVEATLRQDKEYTNELHQMCVDKAKTWDQRKQARSNELATLTEAIGIVRGAVKGNTSASTIRFAQRGVSVRLAKVLAVDASSMNAIESAAEEAEASPVLMQVFSTRRGMLRASAKRHSDPAGGRDVVVRLLRAQGKELRSTLLTALASKIAGDPFAKVKSLIQELIERLLQEAANEATQKGWCDKATADAKQKRDFAAEEIASLNAEMEKLEADRDRLSEELLKLGEDISELTTARSNATSDRAEEKAQNEATVDEAQQGLSALSMCMDLLDKFYKTLKKETVDLSLAQGPMDDAPDSGFANGMAYTGSQSEAGGILGMLDVMKSDFIRTVADTEKAEAQAEQDHLEFMTETGKTLAQKEEAESQKTDQRNDVVTRYQEADVVFGAENDKLKGALHELQDLKPTCIDTGMSYTDRVSHRQEEIDSLNKAMCILGKYEQFGPDGVQGC